MTAASVVTVVALALFLALVVIGNFKQAQWQTRLAWLLVGVIAATAPFAMVELVQAVLP